MRIMNPEGIRCPGCGYGIEFFHDEAKRTCPRCGREVTQGREEVEMAEERPLKGCAVEGRNVRVILCRCPGCGKEIEMFSDETKTTCPHCGREVTLSECEANPA